MCHNIGTVVASNVAHVAFAASVAVSVPFVAATNAASDTDNQPTASAGGILAVDMLVDDYTSIPILGCL